MLFDSKPLTRYEKQMQNVDHLVLENIRQKNVYLNKRELQTVLEVLYDWRVID
ncbi:hypothetical protein [Bacillus phage BM-P1]|nr:hypothetical protein BSP14_167 [Bacillus phage BSP14]UJJ74727.1 hypothetical protein [Bacillus phage BM-P1]